MVGSGESLVIVGPSNRLLCIFRSRFHSGKTRVTSATCHRTWPNFLGFGFMEIFVNDQRVCSGHFG